MRKTLEDFLEEFLEKFVYSEQFSREKNLGKSVEDRGGSKKLGVILVAISLKVSMRKLIE